MKLYDLRDELKNRRTFGFFDDFDHIVTGDRWTITATDSGTGTVGAGVGGILTLAPSDGTVADNDEIYVATQELFKFAADKPAVFEAEINWTEANTDDANVCLGFMDAVGANSIQDDGAGPKASYSGAVFFKADGDTAWTFETSLAGAQTTTVLDNATPGGTYQTLRIEAREAGDVVEIVPMIDGLQCKDTSGNLVKHTISLGSPTEMSAFIGAKNGSANNESITVDYIAAYQLR